MQARRGELINVLAGEGLVAERGDDGVGVVTWFGTDGADAAEGSSRGSADVAATEVRAGDAAAEVRAAEARTAEVRALAVEASVRGQGVGRALLEAAQIALAARGFGRAWLVTTNDNLAALALYQKAGWRLSALRAGALDEARRTLKPEIGSVGEHGIPLRDELELVKDL